MIKYLLIDILGRRKDNFDWRSTMPSLDLAAVDSICVLHHNEKTGDAILISLLIDALARARPGLKIFVGAPSAFIPYWSEHPAVAQAIPFELLRGSSLSRSWRSYRAGNAWRERFDVVVSFHPFARSEQFALLRGLKARVAIGFNKDPYRLFDYSLEEHRHGVDLSMIATRTQSVMKLFGKDVDVATLRPHLPFGPHDESIAEGTLSKIRMSGPKVLVNVYGAGHEKFLTPDSTIRILEEVRRVSPSSAIYVSAPKGKEGQFRMAIDAIDLDGVAIVGPQKGLSSLCALVSAMDVVISPDTSIGHIAAGFQKPQVCLFGRRGSAPKIWRPLNHRCTVLVPPFGDSVNEIDWSQLGSAVREAMACVEMVPAG